MSGEQRQRRRSLLRRLPTLACRRASMSRLRSCSSFSFFFFFSSRSNLFCSYNNDHAAQITMAGLPKHVCNQQPRPSSFLSPASFFRHFRLCVVAWIHSSHHRSRQLPSPSSAAFYSSIAIQAPLRGKGRVHLPSLLSFKIFHAA